MKHIKLGMLFLSLYTITACSPLDENQDFIEAKIATEWEVLTPNRLTATEGISARKRGGCQCRITLDGSPNMQNTYYIHETKYINANGQTGTLYMAGQPNIPLPHIYDFYHLVKRNSPFRYELPFDYDVNPLEESATFTVKLACEVAPPYIKTFTLPPFSKVGGGTITLRGNGRVTQDCGTEEVQLSLD